jgi:hypothetical protein
MLHVFVSSVIADTVEERAKAQIALQSLGIVKTWVFEFSPASEEQVDRAYLNQVEKCNLFILILGSRITDPVLREWASAHYPNPKPVLVFIREEQARDQRVKEFITEIKVKYKIFTTVDQFGEYLVEAVRDWLIRTVESAKPNPLGVQRQQYWGRRMLHWQARCNFERLTENEPRTPLELIKDMSAPERVIPLMAKLPLLATVREQIQFVQEHQYANQYADSVAEHEAELIGYGILQLLTREYGPFLAMYDAGCANCAQYRSLMCTENEDVAHFKYFGQDFNPDWRNSFSVINGTFIEKTLPEIEDVKCDLVACAHTLHYLEWNPLAIYASFFSFNTILKDNGICYVTVPTKDSQPGIIDVLQQSALDAGFEIISCERMRMRHTLSNVASWNITTFVSIILQKKRIVDLNRWRDLCSASQYRGGARDSLFSRDNDIPDDIRQLEENLRETLAEDDPFVRLFRHFLRIAYTSVDTTNLVTPKECSGTIENSIKNLHEAMVGGAAKRNEVARASAQYFISLIRWFLSDGHGRPVYEIISRLHPTVLNILHAKRNVRVVLSDLTPEATVRLMRNLFEVCRFYQFSLRDAVESEIRLNQDVWAGGPPLPNEIGRPTSRS